MKPWSAVLHITGLTMGFLVGLGANWFLSQEPQQPIPPTRMTSARDESSCSYLTHNSRQLAPSIQFSLADIRIAIREEMRAEFAEHRPQSNESHDEAPSLDEGAVERQRLAYEEASQYLRQAINNGAWTQEDRQRLRGVLHELPVPQQDQIIGELFSSIQSGRLKIEGGGTPL